MPGSDQIMTQADFEKYLSEMNKDKITQQDTVGQQLKG